MRHVDSVRATELLGFEGSFATRHVFKTQPYLHDRPSCLRCPDALSMVGASLSGNGCGSPITYIVLFTRFIVDKFKKKINVFS